jgi:hypothetical protein
VVVVFFDLLAALHEQGLVDAQIPRDVVVLRAPLLPDRDPRIVRRAQRGERPTERGPGTIGCGVELQGKPSARPQVAAGGRRCSPRRPPERRGPRSGGSRRSRGTRSRTNPPSDRGS